MSKKPVSQQSAPVAHTPVPWRRHSHEEDAIVACGDGKPIALVYAPNRQRTDAECAANLTFIVQAVNAHHGLVAACTLAVELLDSDHKNSKSPIVVAARAALAKLEAL